MSVGESKSGAVLKVNTPVFESILNRVASVPEILHTTLSFAVYVSTFVAPSKMLIVSLPVIIGKGSIEIVRVTVSELPIISVAFTETV